VIPERVTSATIGELYRAYHAHLPGWFRRLGLSKEEAKDASQTLWLLVVEKFDGGSANLPNSKNELSRLVSNIARNVQRRAVRDKDRHACAIPDELPGSIPNAEDLAYARDLIAAIDQLDDSSRDLFIANKILGYQCPEIAAMTGLTDDTIWIRVWNACAQIQKKLGNSDERKDKRGIVIAPADIEIKRETRAVFCAIWSAEGRMPQFGGPKDPPPPFPSFVKAAPILSEAARGVTLRVNQTILLILLLFTSAGTVALLWIWEPGKVNTARSGLRMPPEPIEEIPDVVDEYQGNTSPPVQSAQSAPVAPAKPLNSQERRSLRLDRPGHTRSGSASE
jgi:DNA-directed RNA polymerase specialized sigma24 family protein